MEQSSRVHKTFLNARINFVFYFITLGLSFFSRKIFLDNLGAEFMGLTGTLSNILGYLNLAEFGVSAAISYHLYKPIQTNDRQLISKLISLFGYYYRNIGIIVGVIAVLFSISFPWIFKSSNFPLSLIYFAFISILSSSLLGYFVNFRQILLSADQKNYLVVIYYQTSIVLKTLIQMYIAYKYKSLYAWVAIELVFGFLYAKILNWRINKIYPWLHSSISLGKTEAKDNPTVLSSTKRIFIHKIKDFLLTQSDQLFVFIFVSIKMVAYYGNYVVIITKISVVLNTILDSVGASIGNLVAEGDKPRILRVFWEITILRFLITGIVSFALIHLVNPFIVLWLGEQYLLGNEVLYLMVVNYFIMGTRGTVDNFNFAYGHYADIWAAWTELGINLSVTIICGYLWGISGILMGKIVSLIPIIVFWKPYYLFKDGFCLPYIEYWKQEIKYYVILIISWVIASNVVELGRFNPSLTFGNWLLYAIVSTGVFSLLYFCGLMFWGPGGKSLLLRLPLNKVGIKIKMCI